MKKVISILLALTLALACLPWNPVLAAGSRLTFLEVESTQWELEVGETAQLTANPLDETGAEFPGAAVDYQSLNPYVATVNSDGMVEAQNLGFTKVLVTAEADGVLVSKTITLDVTEEKAISFEDMTAGVAPTGMQATSLATVTDTKGSKSSQSVYLDDRSTSETAFMHYQQGTKEKDVIVKFDLLIERGQAQFKLLNGGHSYANTMYWIGFENGKLKCHSNSWQILSSSGVPNGGWHTVKVIAKDFDNPNSRADVYVDDVFLGSVPRESGSYGTNMAGGLDGIYFLSAGGAADDDSFYVDNFSFGQYQEREMLTLDQSGVFDLASASEDVIDETGEKYPAAYDGDEFSTQYGFAHIPFTFTDGEYVYANYSRHRDVVMDDPVDALKTYSVDTILNAAEGDQLQENYEKLTGAHDLFLMSAVKLSDGRYYAQNYIPYYKDSKTARTTGWLVSEDGSWEKIEGTMTMPEKFQINGNPNGSPHWYAFVFSKGITVLEDGTLLCTMYGTPPSASHSMAILVESHDLGKTWTYRSTIAENDGTYYNVDGSSINYYEPSLQRCADGSLLSIIRSDSYKPLWQCRSYDDGKNWSKPETLPGVDPYAACSIYPQTVLLENGVLALTSGRPNNILLFSLDGSGYKWDYPITTMAGTTTGNTSIAQIAENTLFQIGDRGFNKAENGGGVWGTTVKVTRNDLPDPALDSAVLNLRRADGTLLDFSHNMVGPADGDVRVVPNGIFDENGKLLSVSGEGGAFEIHYYSETPEIAEVDENTGAVTVLRQGDTVLTAAITEKESGKTILSSITLNTYDPEQLYQFDVSLDTICLKPEDQAALNLSPANRNQEQVEGVSYTYQSSDEAVATVADGTVTAVAPGSAKITVTAQKGGVSLTDSVAVCVESDVWKIWDFEDCTPGTTTMPAGMANAFDLAKIVDAGSIAGSTALYIRDDVTDKAFNVTAPLGDGQCAVVEFWIYPEKSSSMYQIGLGDGANSLTNDSIFLGLGFVGGSTQMKVMGYDGTWQNLVTQSGLEMGAWNRVRIEATASNGGKIYINGNFVTDLPCNAKKEKLSRIRFSTGSTGGVDEYYYIDNLMVMTPETNAPKLTELSLGGSKVNGFQSDLYEYSLSKPRSLRGAALVSTADPADAQVRAEWLDAQTAQVAVQKDGVGRRYNLSFRWYDDDDGTVAPKSLSFKINAASIRYIEGYPDNTFGPEKFTTRAEFAQMLYRLCNLTNVPVKEVALTDVATDMWAYEAIKMMAGQEVILAKDGLFRPDDPITRGEAVRALAMLLGRSPTGHSSFSDCQDYVYDGYLAVMEQLEIAQGYPDHTFRPEQSLTRAEMVSLVNRTVGKEEADVPSTFDDLKEEHWARKAIMAAAK